MKKLILGALALALAVGGSVEARPRHHHVVHSSAYAGGDEGYYTNVDGNSVHRPAHRAHRPSGATARCGDGTWSFSRHHQGTCSHHGGVSSWL